MIGHLDQRASPDGSGSTPNGEVRIGVDLGGTKIEAIALAPRGDEPFRRRIPTPAGDYHATVAAIAALVAEAEAALAGRHAVADGVGIGIPGTISPATGLVKNANSTWLNGRPLLADLAAALGRPVRIANDANCFALSEATDGAAAGAGTVFGVILGTGVGGGLVVGGAVLTGANAIAGEWGHNPLPPVRTPPSGGGPDPAEWPGPPCWCGRSGCIETLLSGPGLARDHARHTGRHLTAAAIASAAANGAADAIATLERHAQRLARALATVVNLFDPDVVVLGGGLSQVASLYVRVPTLWGAHIFSDRVDTRLVPPRHGDSSGVRGAARLWAKEEDAR